MAEIDPVTLRLMVEDGQFLSDIRNLTRVVDQRFGSMEQSAAELESRMRASLDGISTSLKGLAAAAGIGISIDQVSSLADTYTRYTNSLKVAGLEGDELSKVQNKLFDIAQKYGSELESVGTLYSRIAANSKDLGLNQEQLLELVSGTSAALKVSGQSAEEASGALLQLSQALGGSKIQAEEYNSLIDGARPLLQAVANGSDRFAGSVTKLTEAVKGGTVSTREFVQAGLRGMPSLMADAEKAAFTLSGAITILNNALGKYIGEADQSLSASAKVSQGISYIAENLRVIIPALATVAAAIGIGYAAAAAKGAVASAAMAAANTRAALTAEALTTATYQANVALLGERAAAELAAASVTRLAVAQGAAAGAGRALLAVVGGPIGAATLALGAGFAILAAREAAAKAASDDLSASIQAMREKFAPMHKEHAKAAAETNNLTKEQREAITVTANLTGEAHLLANAWARVAAEAKNASLEQARVDLRNAQRQRYDAQKAVDERSQVQAAKPSNKPGYTLEGAVGRLTDFIVKRIDPKEYAETAKKAEKEKQDLQDAIQSEADATRALNEISAERLSKFREDDLGAVSADTKKSAKSAASHAKSRDRSEQELARLAIEELQARLALATGAQERADLQSEMLAVERKQRVAEINADDQLSAAQKKAALARIDKLYGPAPTDGGEIPVSPGLLPLAITQQKEEQLAREALDRAQASAQNDQDLLRAQADLAVTRSGRRELELRMLDLAYEQERLDQQAIVDSTTASKAQQEIAKARLAILEQLKGYDAERIGRQYESPLEQRRRQVRETAANMSDAVENIELNAVDRLGDSLADATTEFLHLGGVAGDVLNSIINDFIRLAAQQAIFGSLGGGSGGGGLLGGLGKLFGIAGARAAGGPVSGGQTYLVGENGPELFRAPTSGTIVPNHQLNATAAASMTGVRAAVAGTTGTVAQALHFDLRGAVVTEDLLAQMNQMAQEAAIQGAQGGRALAARDLKAMSRPRM